MKTGTTLLIVGANLEKRREKVNEILGNIFPESAKFNPNLLILKGDIGIEQVRNFKLALSQKPYSGLIQVGLIEIDDITPEAQNALLKLIEEPPPSSQIVISVENLEKLLPTLVSRCRKIFTIDEKKVKILPETIQDARVILGNNLAKKFILVNNFEVNGSSKMVDDQIFFWHELFLVKLGVIPKHRLEIGEIAKEIELVKILKILTSLFKAKNLLKQNVNSRLLLENLFLSI